MKYDIKSNIIITFSVVLLLLVSLCSCQQQNVEYVMLDKSARSTLNNEKVNSDWQTDESGFFEYMPFKPQGDNFPYIDKEESFKKNTYLYTDGIKYGFMDSEFKVLTDLISDEPPLFINGIAQIYNGEKHYFISSDYLMLPVYYPGFVINDDKIIEIENDGTIKSYSFTIGGIESNKYLVPAKLYASKLSDDNYKVGFTTLGKAISENELTIDDFLLPPEFEDARLFHDGLAAVKKDGKWGFINSEGDILINCEYTEVNDFGSGYAAVFKDELPGYREMEKNIYWGVINNEGDLVLNYTYPKIGRFINGMAVAEIDDYGLISRTYIDPEGNDMLNRIPSIDELGYFTDGIGLIDTGTGFYFVNDKCNRLFDASFSKAKVFSEGLAAVVISDRGPWSYIDINGTSIIEGDYLFAGSFGSGYAYVFDKDTKSGYVIDKYSETYLEELDILGMTIVNEDGYALAYSKDKSTEDSDNLIYYMIRIVNQ